MFPVFVFHVKNTFILEKKKSYQRVEEWYDMHLISTPGKWGQEDL